MNKTQQETHFDNVVRIMKETLLKKGNDYSNEDRLSNFKLGAAIIGLTPAQQCLALISTKVARLGNLISQGKKPDNESLKDNVLDLALYAVLLDMILYDEVPQIERTMDILNRVSEIKKQSSKKKKK